MYFDYIRERRPEANILDTEKGFAIYSYQNDGEAVYIEEIYVKPEFRKEDVASELSKKIQQEAKDKGCLRMLGSVSPSANGSTTSLRVLLAHGMKLLTSQDDLIWFYTEL